MTVYCNVFVSSQNLLDIRLSAPDPAPTGTEGRAHSATIRAKAYEVAAYLERIAAKERLSYTVEAHASDRLVRIRFNTDDLSDCTFDVDMMVELGIEACCDAGLAPHPVEG